jgi:hypothetical protein
MPNVVVAQPYAIASDSLFRSYDVALDGQRFLMIKDHSPNTNARQPTIVLNWLDEISHGRATK